VDAALIGGLAAALVSLAGIVVGVLTSRQANRRLRQEHQDEQARLKLDAAMQAGALFSATDQRAADPAAIASGLLALTRLDRADLGGR